MPKHKQHVEDQAQKLYGAAASSDQEKQKGGQSLQPPPLNITAQAGRFENKKRGFKYLRSVDKDYENETKVQRGDLGLNVQSIAISYKILLDTSQQAQKELKSKKGLKSKLSNLIPGQKDNSLEGLQLKKLAENIISPLGMTPFKVPVESMYQMELGEFCNFTQKVLNYLSEYIALQNFPIDFEGNIDHKILKDRLVHYSDKKEQEQTGVFFKGSKLYRSSGVPVDTSNSATFSKGKGYEIFVMGPKGNIHLASHKLGKYHHSSLLGGGEVALGGEIKVSNGVIKWLSNKSGHYKPSETHLQQILYLLKKKGVPMNFGVEFKMMIKDNDGKSSLKEVEFGTASEYLSSLSLEKTYDYQKSEYTFDWFIKNFGNDKVSAALKEKNWTKEKDMVLFKDQKGKIISQKEIRSYLRTYFRTREN